MIRTRTVSPGFNFASAGKSIPTCTDAVRGSTCGLTNETLPIIGGLASCEGCDAAVEGPDDINICAASPSALGGSCSAGTSTSTISRSIATNWISVLVTSTLSPGLTNNATSVASI